MGRAEILSCPVGEMRDMIACYEIAEGSAHPKVYGDLDDLEKIQ